MKTIPKIIHQIWDGDNEMPKLYRAFPETWKEQYPDWKYRLWNDKQISEFVGTYYPQYAEIFNSFPYNVLRWDSVRYLILNKIGGMYIDIDYESLKPIDELLCNKTCCFALEPKINWIRHNKKIILSNALIASIPEHPFLLKIINTVFSAERQKRIIEQFQNIENEHLRKSEIVIYSTGPWMLSELFLELSVQEKQTVTLLPAEQVCPLSISEVRAILSGKADEKIEELVENAYALHYFFGDWQTNTK